MPLHSSYALLIFGAVTCVLILTSRSLNAEPQSVPKTGILAVLQPFVDRHALAGAVTLVANKQGVVSLDAIGWADVAARKPLKNGRYFLDRIAIKTNNGNRAHDAGRRG